MQYSTINGQRVIPFPKAKGICSVCGAATFAKCGEKVIWHWSHKSLRDCDPWWENETLWHRNWKERFPEHYREIVHRCDITGDKHRADIKSDKGIVLEIQNSPISPEEMRSRENFYKNMVWIINGEKFKSRFMLHTNTFLPDPGRTELDDIMFIPTDNLHSCTMYWRKSENPTLSDTRGNNLARIHCASKIQGTIKQHYVGHHPFVWKRPHVSWLEAKCPVFIDFGTDILWKIESYKGRFHCVRAVAKESVIQHITVGTHALNIARGHSILID